MALKGFTFLSFLAGKQFDGDKTDDETCADQRLLAKRGTGNAEIVVSDVRHRIRHERRAAQRKKQRDCGMDELLHLDAPRVIHPLRARGILECCPAYGCQENPVRRGRLCRRLQLAANERGFVLRRDTEELTK